MEIFSQFWENAHSATYHRVRKNGRGWWKYYKLFTASDLSLRERTFEGFLVDPSDEDGMGQSENGEENKVRADPIFTLGKGGGEKGGDPAQKG